MRSVWFIASGLLMWAGLALLGRLFTVEFPGAGTTVTLGFVLGWLALCLFNLWVGVAKAGYGVGAELPIFALVFLVPAAVAVAVRWKWLG